MKQTFIVSLIIIVLGAIFSLFTSGMWIAIVLPSTMMISMQIPGRRAFGAGFLGVALLWLVLILIKDVPNHHILSSRMAGLLGLPNSAMFILVNILLGGLIGGLSGWSGAVLNKAFRK
ncbi:MAG: hypothetical protein JNK00_12345 [Flavipsychrobacter sp.]|nr:hypothetical protein [Flavipsychrobacter sp.]